MNPTQLDEAYDAFTANPSLWIPEGIIDVDLHLLDKIGLLTYDAFKKKEQSEELPHFFHVIETSDKVTLFNHQFAIWIVPKFIEGYATTIVMISLIKKSHPHLEVVFSTKGIYNVPKFILKLLKYYLYEVIDTEEAISSIGKNGQI